MNDFFFAESLENEVSQKDSRASQPAEVESTQDGEIISCWPRAAFLSTPSVRLSAAFPHPRVSPNTRRSYGLGRPEERRNEASEAHSSAGGASKNAPSSPEET